MKKNKSLVDRALLEDEIVGMYPQLTREFFQGKSSEDLRLMLDPKMQNYHG